MEGHAALHLEPRPRLGVLQQEKLASACGFRSGVSTSGLAPSREPALRSVAVSCPEQTADPHRAGPGQPGCGCRGRPGRGPSGALGHRRVSPCSLAESCCGSEAATEFAGCGCTCPVCRPASSNPPGFPPCWWLVATVEENRAAVLEGA